MTPENTIAHAIAVLRALRGDAQETAAKYRDLKYSQASLRFHEGRAHGFRFAISLLDKNSPEAQEIDAEMKQLCADAAHLAEIGQSAVQP